MKRWFVIVLACLVSICSCNKKPKIVTKINETSEFEFQLLEEVTDADFSSFHCQKNFGSHTYWNVKYGDSMTIQNEDPPRISYDVTSWPDYSSRGQYITGIVCSDPEISILGFTTETDMKSIQDILKEYGFEVKEEEISVGQLLTATQDDITIQVNGSDGGEKVIGISAEITNKNHVEF